MGFRDTGPAHPLNHPARKGPYIGSPVTPDLGFVPYPAQGGPDELSSQGRRDASPQGCLPHAGGADEAEDRSLQVPYQGKDGDVIQDPVLHLLQAEVGLIEDFAGQSHIQVVFGLRHPGEAQNPIQIGPDHRRFRSHRVQVFQPVQLPLRPFLGLGREGRMAENGFQVGQFPLRCPQLLGDGFELLLEVHLPPPGIHLLLDLFVQLLLDPENLQFPHENLAEDLQMFVHLNGFQEFLFLHG